MKLAHLILAHKDPQQVERLVKRLSHEDAYFFIHIDKKADIASFLPLAVPGKVFFVHNRAKVTWGGWGMVQATINGFQEILTSGIKFDYINLLSGQDYPIKSTRYIHDFLADNPGKVFMHCEPIMINWKEAAVRVSGYQLVNYSFPGRYMVEKLMNRYLPVRSLKKGMIAAGRSQWFTASADSVQYIIDFIKENPWIVRHFKFSWGADEVIFQTILFNSQFSRHMTVDNLMHADWTKGGASPKTFGLNDLRQLQQTDKLFARKFDAAADARILDMLDRMHDRPRIITLMPHVMQAVM